MADFEYSEDTTDFVYTDDGITVAYGESSRSLPRAHASTHEDNGTDEITLTSMSSGAATDGQVLTADGAGGIAWEDITHNELSGLQGGTTDEYYHFTSAQHADLTDSGDSSLHYHSADRNRANHTGSQTAATISDFDTEVSNNTDVAANTSARHDAVTVSDSSEIDFTLTNQQISGSLIAASIDETKLDASVNASLDLADSSLQSTGSSTDHALVRWDGSGGDAVQDTSVATMGDSGNTSIGSDTDITMSFGRGKFGWIGSNDDTFYLGHLDYFDATYYALKQDSNGRTYLSANDFVGIYPENTLTGLLYPEACYWYGSTIYRKDGGNPACMFEGYVDSAVSPSIYYRKARGSLASPTDIQNGDGLGNFYWSGYLSNVWCNLAQMSAQSYSPSGTNATTYLTIKVDSGSGLTTCLVLASNQTRMPDGTVWNPGWTFIGETSSGVYRIGSYNVGAVAGGSLAFSWKSDGIYDCKLIDTNADDDLELKRNNDTIVTVGSSDVTLNTGIRLNVTQSSQVATHLLGQNIIEINNYGSGDRPAIIDFHAQDGTDYDARISRGSGANATFDMVNTGTGDVRFYHGTSTLIYHYDSSGITLASGKTLDFNGGQAVDEITTTVSGSSADDQLPTAKAVYDALFVQAHGEIYGTGLMPTQNIATGSTYVKLTACFTNNGDSDGVTTDVTNDKLTFTKTGKYLVIIALALDGASGVDYTLKVHWNGSAQNNLAAYFTGAGGTTFKSVTICGILDVTSTSTDMDLRAIHDSGSDRFIYQDQASNLTVVRIGDT